MRIVRYILMVWILIPSGLDAAAQQASPMVKELMVEYLKNPIGIDELKPRFFWKLQSERRNTLQKSYQLRVSTDEDFSDSLKIIFDTGMIASSQSTQLEYDGPALQSQTRYFWQVRIWDNAGMVSEWSETAFWETGLLHPDEWVADWIEAPWLEEADSMQASPMMRYEFPVNKEVLSARAYISSHGLYEMRINGVKAGENLFTPGWTSFHNRLQYQTYDLTETIKQGKNAIGVILADGWFRGNIGWENQRSYYGDKLSLIAQLVIKYRDGSSETIASDDQWMVSAGPIRYADIYQGEYYDARLEMPGWDEAGFDASGWQQAALARHDKNKLIAQQGPAVMRIQEIKPIEIIYTPAGDTVFDMGQNMVGWVRLQVEGPGGTRIVLRHAEVLDSEGNFYTENLRSAAQTNTYILKGDGLESWEPRFSFQGFRYVAIHGYPGEPTKESLSGVVVHSDMEATGHFDCSDPMVNRLQHNIVWGQKGNFLDVPTDCPQRDERMGWTGDAQVFVNTASINMFTPAFFTKWLADLASDQFDNGSVPHVVPNVLGPSAGGAAGWADAATIVPWAMYEYFGDTRILERQYESMRAWVEYMKMRALSRDDPFIWTGDFHFGDWLSFNTTKADYPGAYTERDMIATAYFAHSANLMSKAAGVLGKKEDAAHYEQLFENIRTAFNKEFVTPNARVVSDTQTAYLLALKYNLLPQTARPLAAAQLSKNIQRFGHLTTGFLGTPHLNPVLSEFGYDELAYHLLLRQNYPSWLYPITKDATTIWERWDGIKPDGSFQDKDMNSYNHYAYGAIGEWFVRYVAGIKNLQPGYQSIMIEPKPGGGLRHARAIQHSLYGPIVSAWSFEDNTFVLEVSVPENTFAEIMLPYARMARVRLDGNRLRRSLDVYDHSQGKDFTYIKISSGSYRFTYPSADFPDRSLPVAVSKTGMDWDDSLNDRLADMLADEEARKVLFEEMPGLMASPWLSQVMGFSLIKAMESIPCHLRADQEVIDRIEERLKKLRQ